MGFRLLFSAMQSNGYILSKLHSSDACSSVSSDRRDSMSVSRENPRPRDSPSNSSSEYSSKRRDSSATLSESLYKIPMSKHRDSPSKLLESHLKRNSQSRLLDYHSKKRVSPILDNDVLGKRRDSLSNVDISKSGSGKPTGQRSVAPPSKLVTQLPGNVTGADLYQIGSVVEGGGSQTSGIGFALLFVVSSCFRFVSLLLTLHNPAE